MDPRDEKVASYFKELAGKTPEFKTALERKIQSTDAESTPADNNSLLAIVVGLEASQSDISAYRTELFRANVVGEDFSDLVPNNAEMVEKSNIKEIPRGAIIAFNSVPAEREEVDHWIGPRKLQHLMISLGDGKAIGCENWSRVGIGAKTSTWEVLDLNHLNWFPTKDGETPRLDPINGAPREEKRELPLRGRYRLLSEILNEKEQISSDDVTSRLLKRISPNTCICLLESNENKTGDAEKGELIRLNIKCRIPENLYHHVFNGLYGVRGRFFDDAKAGEDFTKTLLQKIAEIKGLMDKIQKAFRFHINTRDTRNILKNALVNGKIWTIEEGVNVIPFKDHPDCYPPLSQRWREELDQINKNWKAFYTEIGGNDQGRAAENKPDDANNTKQKSLEDDLKDKLNNNGVFGSGAGFWRSNTEGPNLDIKSSWIHLKAPSANAGVAEIKVSRSQQIKYFGFT